MRDLMGVHQPSRVKGRPALVRRLRGLLVAVHRFAKHRATSRADLWWSARTVDALTAALDVADDHNAHTRSKESERPEQHSIVMRRTS